MQLSFCLVYCFQQHKSTSFATELLNRDIFYYLLDIGVFSLTEIGNIKILWRIWPLLGNGSVSTLPRQRITQKNRITEEL
jgi:hypothetical protein